MALVLFMVHFVLRCSTEHYTCVAGVKSLFKVWQLDGHGCWELFQTQNFMLTPKNRDTTTLKSAVIYRREYARVEYDEEYTDESSRTFGERCKEHLKAPSPNYDHH